ncbi:hypothetical protein [Poseidonocella sp. HB161398]|uniref:hypothetical protein n=1 Tax=Poseidonocella sp. HB161398 TaxID=2320855 RepID=UPI0011099A59|nr:hypothetical protein [Poseidonocella sp. HB161398]
MLTFLVFLTAMVLIVCSSGMLSVVIGPKAWFIGGVAALAFAGWVATHVGIAPLAVIAGLIFLAPSVFLAAIAIVYNARNRKLPPQEHKTFGEVAKAALRQAML